jgi:hypothetical protein
MLHKATLVIAGLMALASCSTEPAPIQAPPLGADFTLAPSETATIGATGLAVTFVRVVSESRCPVNPQVQCIWEGTAQLQLRVSGLGGTRDVPIETLLSANTATVDGYLIRLLELTPSPRAEAPTSPDRYRATFRVVRAN